MIPNSIISWITRKDFSDADREEVLNYLCLNSIAKSSDIKKKSENFLKGQPNLERVSREFIAKQLGISPRTYSRKLKKQDTCFQELLDNERKRRCFYFLNNNVTSGAEISHHLGFSEPAYFYVTFKKWTSISFSEFKVKMEKNNTDIDHTVDFEGF